MRSNNLYRGRSVRKAFGILALILLLAGSAGAATLTVNANGSADYTIIQGAINNATAGDTILVYRGTYYENVNVNKQLALRGIGMPVVDARESGSTITLSANGITLDGFTATGGGSYGIVLRDSYNNTLNRNNASNNYHGIYLDNSSNNILSGNNANSNNEIGIGLSSSSNNTMIENNASNNGNGISVWSSSNNTMINNNASNNGNGILLYYFSNNVLNGNEASSNNKYGIYLDKSSNNTMNYNNARSNNYSGISLYDSSNNTLISNNASNNWYGIYLESSSNNTMSGNMMTGNQENFDLNGDTDLDFDNHIDTSNLVNGRPIYYIIKASDTIYDTSTNAGTLYCIGCVNVTIYNLNLNKKGRGIYFWNTSQSRIQNINASNNSDGIFVRHSSNNTLNGNNVSSNYNYGIYLDASSNNTLNNNNASNNNYGISVWYSSNNTLNGNNASSNNNYGIDLSSSSNNNALIRNNASNNHNGIYLVGSSKNTMNGNNASNNFVGIYLDWSNDNTLSENSASNNGDGVYLVYSSNNTIYNNYFSNTNNANDNGNNIWSINKTSGTNIIGGPYLGGNFWSDYAGKDTNGDGLGDTMLPYNSSSRIADGGDYLPLIPLMVLPLKNPSHKVLGFEAVLAISMFLAVYIERRSREKENHRE